MVAIHIKKDTIIFTILTNKDINSRIINEPLAKML